MTVSESQIVAKGREIFSKMGSDAPQVFNTKWWHGKIMDWCMSNPAFKVEMFRFVDVMPCLKTTDQVGRHLREYFCRPGQSLPAGVQTVLGGITASSLITKIAALTIQKNTRDMARMFIVGANPDEALKEFRRLRKSRLAFTVDVLGEAAVSEEESDEYQRRYLELLTTMAAEAKAWKDDPLLDANDAGPIPRVNVSVKVSALDAHIDPIDPDGSIATLKGRLIPIFRKALETGAFLNLDIEQYSLKDLTLRLFKELCSDPEFAAYPHWGLAIQAYLREAEADIDGLIEWAKGRGTGITVRLVKGAYWDYETVHAKQQGWPAPVYTDKAATDACFERCARKLIENYRWTRPALASHNVRSLASAMACAEEAGVPKQALEVQMLYGMAEPLKTAMLDMGYRVRDYAPVGELIPGMAYLVRRLLENTSNESWLRLKFVAGASMEQLLKAPEPKPEAKEPAAPRDASARLALPFRNEPLLDFCDVKVRARMVAALRAIEGTFAKTWPLVIGGRPVAATVTSASVSPSNPARTVGTVYQATKEEAEDAVQAALKAFPAWRDLEPAKRAEYLLRVADILRSRRLELAAVEVFEEAKPWREADGDVAEAIDFLEYYAREAVRLSKPRRCGNVPGEDNRYFYQPRGVGAIVAPWNFPLAILCGMTSAAIVAGNTVVVKPASTAPVIAAYLFEAFREVGLPTGVANYCPGPGREVGAHLVNHPEVCFVAFTGSVEVGQDILKAVGAPHPGQRFVKRAILELGGKNAVIVDDDADLDEAVAAIAKSAFAYAGQKCSACSRVIVLDEIYDRLVERLTQCTTGLQIGPAEDPATQVPPVIDAKAQQRIQGLIDEAATRLKVLVRRDAPKGGFYIGPAVFGDVPPTDRIAQEEIFGPVVAVIRVKDFSEALKVANGTPYALTGGVFSRSPGNLERARKEFRVGNLYLNRGITGALVDRQPFGGFAMSGVGSKAGGPDYLLQFLEPRVVTENTMRRGFAADAAGTESTGGH